MALTDYVRQFARMDVETDTQVNAYIAAAEEVLTGAGVAVAESDALYQLAVGMLCAYWNDNRVPAGAPVGSAFDLTGIITTLKYGGGDSNAGGGS